MAQTRPKGATLVFRTDNLEESVKLVNAINLTPTALAAMHPTDYPDLAYILSSGESCPAALLEKWGQHVYFCSDYGPTECSVTATCTDRLLPGTAITLSRPMDNNEIYILDSDRKLVPPGVKGDLYIAGSGVAAGYLNRETLTSERFLPCPFNDNPASKMYFAGDIATWTDSGELVFHGRDDQMVKIHGHRIELAELVWSLSSKLAWMPR
ncbi:hypothetical protein HDU87_004329 [Geranomyces variabilis]|uniref:AMP-dependent synthetase/ligase domain-containing protein n=1 Tax=Geranomyces variabilis TaxID=109894 RepID=A0AAD5TJ58_9FUNG|nr:hypothetical protein HDU87_004329 [Geranomyces variabilis]